MAPRPEGRGRWIVIATCAALSLAAALSGCTSTGVAQTNSAVSTSKAATAPQVRRMLVVANVEDSYFTREHYLGFQAAFSTTLKECGTVVEHLHFNRLDLDWRKSVDDRLRALNADSILVFRNAGGGRVVRGSGGTNSDLNYEARLVDVRGRELWRARTQFRFLSGNLFTVDKAGQGLGKAVADQLRKDDVIEGCRAATAVGKG